MADIPGQAPLPEDERDAFIHIEEGQRLFYALSNGATDGVPLSKMFWGDYWGVLLDRYGIRWMVNVPDPDGAGAR